MDKTKAVVFLAVVAVAAVIGWAALNAYSTLATVNVTTKTDVVNSWPTARIAHINARKGIPISVNKAIEVSEEFKQKVINIAKSDADVQKLLNEGYNIVAVRPVIKTMVMGDGTVVTKATGATLLLKKDTTGLAFARVDVENAKLTKIVIITRTVIEK